MVRKNIKEIFNIIVLTLFFTKVYSQILDSNNYFVNNESKNSTEKIGSYENINTITANGNNGAKTQPNYNTNTQPYYGINTQPNYGTTKTIANNNASNDCADLIKVFQNCEYKADKINIKDSIESGNCCDGKNIKCDVSGYITEIDLENVFKEGVFSFDGLYFTKLNKFNIANNNLIGPNTNYGQFPVNFFKNNRTNTLTTFNISKNRFRGRVPNINSNIQDCKIYGNEFCLFHDDKIPFRCLARKNNECIDNSKNCYITDIKSYENKNGSYYPNKRSGAADQIGEEFFRICNNIFITKKQDQEMKIFLDYDIKDGKKTAPLDNTNIKIIIYSSIFPLCSFIITFFVTVYGRNKSKFNRKDNITRMSASISHLPNNFGNISNNNHQSLLARYDSFNHPAPRSDNDNSMEQKRVSVNTSASSGTPSSPIISPNEIKNSSYRVIGSHYSLNPSQGIRFKNNFQENKNNTNTNSPSDYNNTPTTTSTASDQHMMNNGVGLNNINTSSPISSIPATLSPNDSHTGMLSPTLRSGGSTPSKAKESLDLLLSSPAARYYQSQSNRNEYRRREGISPSMLEKSPKMMSPIQSPKYYSPNLPSSTASPNVYVKSPIINMNKSPINQSPILMNNYSSKKSPNSPTISVPQYMPPTIMKSTSPLTLQFSPNTGKKPRVRRVVYSFIAGLPDELQLTPGQEVIIHKVFDDGYAYGENASSHQFGVFPITSLHPDDQNILPEEIESSPSLNDIQFSQLSINSKNSNMTSPIMNKPMSPSKFNNIKIQDITPSLIINNNNNNNNIINNNDGNNNNGNNNGNIKDNMNIESNYPGKLSNINLYGLNSQGSNSNSQNSNSQNSMTDEDDIDSLRRQSKIDYNAYMNQQKQKIIRKQARQAKKNKMNSLNGFNYYNENEILQKHNIGQESVITPTYLTQKMLNENINNKMFGESQSSLPNQPTQYSQSLTNDVRSASTSPNISRYKNMSNMLKTESPSVLEIQRMEDRRYKQIKLLKERLNKKDIGPEERRYYLQLLQQLTNNE